MKKVQANKWLLLALLSITFSFMSCEDDDSTNATRLTETEFMVRAANSDLFEIQTGRLAAGKGMTAEVRALGQHLVTDHTASSTELKALAAQKNITLPDSLSVDKRTIRVRLAAETGKTFDQDFATTQIAAHDEAISLYQQASSELQDPEIKAFATKILPNLQMHREHAVQVKTKTDAL